MPPTKRCPNSASTCHAPMQQTALRATQQQPARMSWWRRLRLSTTQQHSCTACALSIKVASARVCDCINDDAAGDQQL
eukprot:3619396-Alexandrium_andersonii.AAC.1